MSEINVTPFVDVMLVLLIIFMVTAPLISVGVPVDLPQTQAAQLTDRDEPLIVTVDGEGKVYLQETEVEAAALGPRLVAIAGAKPDTIIYVRADKAINYGRVMEVMGTISSSGFAKVSLVAEFGEPKPARGRTRR
ncbi:MAG: protein TolR [Alphaproteobacteria bacterium]|nr:protein TolR [Alphaproteobacteria bacterium]